MDLGVMLIDAVDYTRNTLWGRWVRWLILLIGTFVFPILMGYTLLVYRGDRSPPDSVDWISIFIDGIKLFIVQLVYAIPIFAASLILNLLVLFPVTAAIGSGGTGRTMSSAIVAVALVAFIVMAVVAILVSMISAMASIRFARTDSFGEAFNISAILAHIGRIGWGFYLLALLFLYLAFVVFGLVFVVFSLLTLGIGSLLIIVLAPAFSILVARYMTLIYDSAPAPA